MAPFASLDDGRATSRVLRAVALGAVMGVLISMVSAAAPGALYQPTTAPGLRVGRPSSIAPAPAPGLGPRGVHSVHQEAAALPLLASLERTRASQGPTTPAHWLAGVVTATLAVAAGLLWGRSRAMPEAMVMMAEAGEAAEGGEGWKGGLAWSSLTKDVKTVSSIDDISKVLPHRYPFLLVDKVIEFEAGKRAVGVKNVTMNEPQFTGHFPGRPIMPGVLMIEAMAQLGGIICLQPPVSDGTGLFFFAGINGVRWRRPVVPGDTLVMEMELVSFKQKFGIAKMKGKAYVDGNLAVDVEEFTFAVAKENR